MKTAALFPGQGSQFVGMAEEILHRFPSQNDTFIEASSGAQLDLLELCTKGSETQLSLTEVTQPAILATSVSWWRAMQPKVDFVAGHSLGEYTALVATGRMSLNDAAGLVRKRGEAMQNAVPLGKGAMAAVLGTDTEVLEKICADLHAIGHVVEIANYNAPGQLVVAGSISALDELMLRLKELRVKMIRLNVSAPFHSSLMQPAKRIMEPLIQGVTLSPSIVPITPNLTGEICAEYKHTFLVEQIDHPVQWIRTMHGLYGAGVRRFIEVGPGRVLLGLAKRFFKDVELHHVSELDKSST